ncbi:MAG: TM2 domain-containing protein [Alphaproteobacteria bacterium]|nr:TM2 domain-containing protein [Alphaproteobacteria bacterium]
MAMIYCRECGNKHSDKAKACPKCGAAFEATLTKQVNSLVNNKSVVVYLVLCWFVGIFGAHRFYAGKNGSGLAILLMGTIGWLLVLPGIAAAIWVLVDFIVGLCHVSNPESLFAKK